MNYHTQRWTILVKTYLYLLKYSMILTSFHNLHLTAINFCKIRTQFSKYLETLCLEQFLCSWICSLAEAFSKYQNEISGYRLNSFSFNCPYNKENKLSSFKWSRLWISFKISSLFNVKKLEVKNWFALAAFWKDLFKG